MSAYWMSAISPTVRRDDEAIRTARLIFQGEREGRLMGKTRDKQKRRRRGKERGERLAFNYCSETALLLLGAFH